MSHAHMQREILTQESNPVANLQKTTKILSSRSNYFANDLSLERSTKSSTEGSSNDAEAECRIQEVD